MNPIELPKATQKRLIQLLQILRCWQSEKITSVAISESTGWNSSLIRHDLWLLSFNKGVSNGYNVAELTAAIQKVLGIEKPGSSQESEESDDAYVNQNTDFQTANTGFKNICIVGLGRLGAALLDESLIDSSLFKIKAGFDLNLYRVEILRSSFPLYPASEMEMVIKREEIKYAILAVQDSGAQQMCTKLVKAGIKGIVNMTNMMLKIPEGVTVENLSISNALKLVI